MKTIYTLLAFVALCFASATKAQSGSGWEWVATTGIADASRMIREVTKDGAGNIYVTGTYYDAITIGSYTVSGTPALYGHVFTAKYDASGNVQWVTPYNGGAGGVVQTASAIAVDAGGNVYIGGTDNGTVGGVGNGFVEKYDNNGLVQWRKVLLLNEVIGLNVGPDGNPIAIESVPGSRNIYKLNSANGNILWTVANTGAAIPVDSHQSYSDFLDSRGNVYYTLYAAPFGVSAPETVAGVTFNNPGGTFCFVSLDNNGNRRWIDTVNNSSAYYGLGGRAVISKTNKLYLTIGISIYTGGLSGTNQSSTPTSAYYELDTLGRVTYRSFLTPFQNSQKLLVKDDGIYSYQVLTGGTAAAVSFGDYTYASPAANTTSLNIIVKYDPVTYAVVFANSFETTGPAYSTGSINGLEITAAGKIVVGGYYATTAKFGSILKTATVVATNPYTKTDFYLAEFDKASVAAPATTTWTGAANNSNFNDAANWTAGVPNFIKTVIPGGLSNYPNNIAATNKISKLQIDAGATVSLPLAISIPGGIVNNGAIEITESGIFYGGFNSGQTLITGTGKVVMKNNTGYYYGSVVLDNSLEINCGGTLTSFGGTINGSLLLTNGIYSGDIVLANPLATITANATNYVAGKITRAVNTSGIYTFPQGTATRYAPVVLKLNSIAGPQKIAVSFSQTINGAAPNTTASGQTVSQLLNSGIWTITPDVALTAGNYTVTLEGRGFTNNVTDPKRYVVVKRPNSAGAWGFFGTNGLATQTPTVITATAGNISGFSDFAIGIAAGSVISTLPVSYTYFTAIKNADAILLKWQTSQAVKANYYAVQHSGNARDWTALGNVDARNGSLLTNYQYTHSSPAKGVNYYRLLEVDADGRSSYSDVRRVDMGDVLALAQLYPNPSSGDVITLNYGKPLGAASHYFIADVQGKTVRSGNVTSSTQTIVVGDVAKGIYRLVLDDGQSIPFIRQ